MSEPIKVGDLVVVVRANPCGCEDRIGLTFLVNDVFKTGRQAHCLTCGDVWDGGMRTLANYGGENTVNVKRLKLIPPLDEMERDQIVRELTA
jgi:hypothetical protein